MRNGLDKSIETMKQRIVEILRSNTPSIYLYGSVILNDFKPGWSDIDLLVLTREPISQEQAEALLYLRQALREEEQGNPVYRSFEGGMLSLSGFLRKEADRVVYWGTSGQRITDRYRLDSFGMTQVLDGGRLLYGPEVRSNFSRPSYVDLKADIWRHYESIRKYARKTGRDLYSYGWLLDISRCIYTLKTGRIIAKTAAGKWALEEGICPCPDVLTRAVAIRVEPLKYLDDPATFDYAETLGGAIQAYADVLERCLNEDEKDG